MIHSSGYWRHDSRLFSINTKRYDVVTSIVYIVYIVRFIVYPLLYIETDHDPARHTPLNAFYFPAAISEPTIPLSDNHELT